MPRRLLSLGLATLFLAACGTAQPSSLNTLPPTTSPTATAAPSPTEAPAGTPSPTSPFAGKPYSLTLPEGWQALDLGDPAGAAALDAFVAANPAMAGSIEAFKALPNVTMAVNALLGNVVVALSLPTGGLPLETLATSFTAQFAAVPGVQNPPQPENRTLPVGPAVHWAITVDANKPGGGTYQVGESVYLVANDTTAVLVEFVEVAGGGIPQEDQIINSLAFTP